ncbi:MAG: 16S rRNA (uracil(1498)-N(3))-methyltransferase [Hyphomicrobiales bacterium]
MRDEFYKTPRLYISQDLNQEADITLDKSQSHYVANVMRQRVDAKLRLFNGRHGEWLAQITSTSKREVVLRIEQQLRPQSPLTDIHYLFAPLKHARLDYMVQKATEMGASRLQPVLTQNTNVSRVNSERMKANAIEAAEQCNLLSIPEISEPLKLDKLLAEWPSERLLIFCDEAVESNSPLETLNGFASQPLAVLVGPEGGFSDDERHALLNHESALAISLGPRIMRADTAAVAALALVQATLGDWQSHS